jgi:hypothetical protein
MLDHGGVSKDFWKRAVVARKWSIDLKSIVMEDAELFPQHYHVAMRKLKQATATKTMPA